MTNQSNSITPINHTALLIKRMLQGAAIALIPISVFLLNAGEPDPAWSTLWMLKPLITVPAAGAMGAVRFLRAYSLRFSDPIFNFLEVYLPQLGFQ